MQSRARKEKKMAYSKQTWDTTSYVNPTRMNHIEDGIEAVGTRTIVQYYGTIINGASGSVIQGVGSATITLDNGNARIDFNCNIVTVDSAESFMYGINRDLFTSITGKTITPVGKGIMSFYGANGALDDLTNGYGGTCEILNNMDKFWRPARVYDTSGNVGGWSSLAFAQGMRIVGTVFGTYA